MFHDLYMGDSATVRMPDDMFDINLRTGETVAKIVHAIIDGEKSGDELVIVVRTHQRRHKR